MTPHSCLGSEGLNISGKFVNGNYFVLNAFAHFCITDAGYCWLISHCAVDKAKQDQPLCLLVFLSSAVALWLHQSSSLIGTNKEAYAFCCSAIVSLKELLVHAGLSYVLIWYFGLRQSDFLWLLKRISSLQTTLWYRVAQGLETHLHPLSSSPSQAMHPRMPTLTPTCHVLLSAAGSVRFK